MIQVHFLISSDVFCLQCNKTLHEQKQIFTRNYGAGEPNVRNYLIAFDFMINLSETADELFAKSISSIV